MTKARNWIPTVVGLAAASVCLLAGDKPSIELRLGSSISFPSGAVVDADRRDMQKFSVELRDTLAEIDMDSLSLALNGNSIMGFARHGRTLRGVSLVVDRADAKHPLLSLLVANHLRVGAEDSLGNKYFGEFRIHLSDVPVPVQRPESVSPSGGRVLFQRSRGATPPSIRITTPSKIPKGERFVQFQAHVSDIGGIRSLTIEVGSRLFEQVTIRNGLPSRQRGRFRTSKRLSGSIIGDGLYLEVDIPIPFRGRRMDLTIQVENIQGTISSSTITVSRGR